MIKHLLLLKLYLEFRTKPELYTISAYDLTVKEEKKSLLSLYKYYRLVKTEC